MSDRVLYSDACYRLVAHGPRRHPVSVIAFDIRRANRHPLTPGRFGEPFLPPAIREAGGPANFLSLQTSRNCWYLDPALDPVLEAARGFCAGTRIVTYGSSMGAYAALNLAGALGADYALALSPLSTIFDPYATAIGDRRFPDDRRLLSPDRDVIHLGGLADLRGLICFDSTHAQDAAHAARIAAATSCDLLDVRHAGHPCGIALNRIYPLRRLLADAVADQVQVAALRGLMLQEIPKLQEAIAADPDRVSAFHDLCRADLTQIRPTSMVNAAALARGLPQRLGPDPATRKARLAELVAWIGDPAMNWAPDPPKRLMAAQYLAEAAQQAGLADLAAACARAHLPPAQAARFTG